MRLNVFLVRLLFFFVFFSFCLVFLSLDEVVFDFAFGRVFVCVEAGDVVIRHRAWRAHILDEADHGPVALRVKFVVIVDLDVRYSPGAGTERLGLHVFFEGIAPVCEESLAVFEFDFHGLVVEAVPKAVDLLPFAFVLGFALLSRCRQVLVQLQLPYFVLLELELVVLRQDLHLVRHLVRAQLVLLVQVHLLLVLTDMEIPRTDRVAEAAYGLICLGHVSARCHERSNDISFLFHRFR